MDAYGRTVEDPATWTWSRAAAAVAETAITAITEAEFLMKDTIFLLGWFMT
jgi:hypothetical protein